MRVLFGGLTLVGLLIGVGIWAYMEAMNASAVSKARKDMNGPVNQIAGRGEDGTNALDSITLSAGYDAGHHLRSLVVDAIVAGGAMEKVYGLKPGDQIKEMGNYPIDPSTDFETARAFLLEAYKAGGALKVHRAGNNQDLELKPEHSLMEQLNGIKAPTGP